eukprot:SAG11_NODE_2239_length_3648_cov_4.089039_2_plen_185_part_00
MPMHVYNATDAAAVSIHNSSSSCNSIVLVGNNYNYASVLNSLLSTRATVPAPVLASQALGQATRRRLSPHPPRARPAASLGAEACAGRGGSIPRAQVARNPSAAAACLRRHTQPQRLNYPASQAAMGQCPQKTPRPPPHCPPRVVAWAPRTVAAERVVSEPKDQRTEGGAEQVQRRLQPFGRGQ